MSTEDFLFPVFEYHLDESDPDIVMLRRQDDTFVAAFSARGITKEGIIDAAKEDYRALLAEHVRARRTEEKSRAKRPVTDSGGVPDLQRDSLYPPPKP